MADAIDNYEFILDFAKKLAKEEIRLGTEKMEQLYYTWEFSIVRNYIGYVVTDDNRDAKIFVISKYGPWNADWVNYLPTDFWEEE